MIDILIAHHLSIVADLERDNAEQTRKDCFKYIDEAIDIFMRVRFFLRYQQHCFVGQEVYAFVFERVKLLCFHSCKFSVNILAGGEKICSL